MGVEFCCFNSAAAWHDGGWGVGWEVACMNAGKPWLSCGFVLGVTRVSVLVLPCEACDSHSTLAAPNPDQPWLPNPAPHLFRPGLAHAEQLPAAVSWITFLL